MKPVEKSLDQFFREYAAACSARRFLFDEERSYTVRDAYLACANLAGQLSALGIQQGSVTALRCTRTLDTCLIYLALQRLGAVVLLTDPHQDICAFLRSAGVGTAADLGGPPDAAQPLAEFLITNEAASPDLAARSGWDMLGKGPLEIPLPEGHGPAERDAEWDLPPAGQPVDLYAPSTVVFTSGSTGREKGVMLSQYNLVNHILNFSVSGCYWETDISAEFLPVHHVFGLAVLLMGLIKRYSILFPQTVSAAYAADCIEKYAITRLDGVPSFALALAEHHRATGFRADSLRVGVLGGAPSTRAQFDFIERELGIQLLPVYGQSECIGITGADETQSADVRASTVGSFLPMNQGFILNESGEEAEPGEEGEVCVRSPAVMLGYLGDPDGTQEAIDHLGRLHTGDLGYLDQAGNLHISGRKKDIIIRSGNNLSAGKIEKAIHGVPGVSQAVVVGVPHEKWGEVPCAAVVLEKGRGGAQPTAEQIRAAAALSLAKNEVPAEIRILSALPLTSSGKPDKQRIRALFTAQE